MKLRNGRARGFFMLIAALLIGAGVLSGGLASAQPATPAASPAASPVGSTSFQITGLVETPLTLTVAEVRKLPSRTVRVTFKAGNGDQSHRFSGVMLAEARARVVSSSGSAEARST